MSDFFGYVLTSSSNGVFIRCPFCGTVLVDNPDYPKLFCPVEYCSFFVDRSSAFIHINLDDLPPIDLHEDFDDLPF